MYVHLYNQVMYKYLIQTPFLHYFHALFRNHLYAHVHHIYRHTAARLQLQE